MFLIKFILCYMCYFIVVFMRDNIYFRVKYLYMERFYYYYYIFFFILMIYFVINVFYKGKFNIFFDKCVND